LSKIGRYNNKNKNVMQENGARDATDAWQEKNQLIFDRDEKEGDVVDESCGKGSSPPRSQNSNPNLL